MTLFDVVTAVIEVTESEHEVVPVVVHLLESGRIRRPGVPAPGGKGEGRPKPPRRRKG